MIAVMKTTSQDAGTVSVVDFDVQVASKYRALHRISELARRTIEGYTFRAVSRAGRGENLVFFGAGPAPSTVEAVALVDA